MSHAGTGLPLTLHWSHGPRPANDDFSQAVRLTGAEGAVEGSNQGATLEPGELFGVAGGNHLAPLDRANQRRLAV